MKKNKSKSKSHSASKKIKKALELKLTIAFTEIASQFGQTKKANSLIEKFAKQLSKKVSIVETVFTEVPAKEAKNTVSKNEAKVTPEAPLASAEVKPKATAKPKAVSKTK